MLTDRDLWLIIRRALLMVIWAIDRKFGISRKAE